MKKTYRMIVTTEGADGKARRTQNSHLSQAEVEQYTQAARRGTQRGDTRTIRVKDEN